MAKGHALLAGLKSVDPASYNGWDGTFCKGLLYMMIQPKTFSQRPSVSGLVHKYYCSK